ncbi:MAG: TetR/AcrR family transcriptional regulator [Deltaproteobacteria bacterium]|nr:TetR/AcrR family transcriptional regulator [Deltaproteobacteria bacterium]
MPSDLRRERDRIRSERRRQAVLDAAARVFVRQGFHRTLISDIAAEAKVGQGTFYRHFPDKPAVFRAVFDRFAESLFAGFAGMSARLPRDAREYRDMSVAAIRELAKGLERNRELALMLLREAPTVDPALQERVDSLHDAFVDLARGYLDHAVAEGFARPCDTRLVAAAIVGLGVAMAHRWWIGRIPGASLDHMIEELVDLVFHGLSR